MPKRVILNGITTKMYRNVLYRVLSDSSDGTFVKGNKIWISNSDNVIYVKDDNGGGWIDEKDITEDMLDFEFIEDGSITPNPFEIKNYDILGK